MKKATLLYCRWEVNNAFGYLRVAQTLLHLDYSLGTTDSGDTGTTDGSLAGPDPYQEGENRLSIGIFTKEAILSSTKSTT